MSEEGRIPDRIIERNRKITLIIGLIFIGLIGFGIFYVTKISVLDVKPSNVEILSEIDVHCYNINWFGEHGFQITYNETIQAIGDQFNKYDMDFVSSDFFNDEDVINYFVINCPHLDSRFEVPENFDPDFGTNVIDKCIEKKIGTANFQDYCAGFIK